jgi:hypothetical protein
MTANRDLVVNLIVRAISTGASKRANSITDLNWCEARSQAFGESAAMAAEQIFQVDLAKAKHVIQLRVRDLRAGEHDLRDGEWAGKEATEIFEDVLNVH